MGKWKEDEIVSGYTRSYTNDKGEAITINEKHIETAIKIKLELQKASPSRRTNWSLHKKLMEQEGFFDSCTCESYRCLIKDEQRKRGLLPSAPKHADMVTSNKLESIKELVGEIAYEKRENQNVLRELNKAKRDIIDYSLIAEQIREAFKNIEIPKVDYDPIDEENSKESNRSMLVLPSDWHIGYFSDTYNYKVARERINKYVNDIMEYAKIFNINKFHIQHLGDIIENLYMHKNTQSFNAEFSFAEQIVKATELLYYMIMKISSMGNVVFHGVVRGNHGRIGIKGENILDDCAEYIVHESVKSLIKLSYNPRVTVDDSEYNIERSMITINGKRIKAIHGDHENQNDRDKIQKHISLENEMIDILVHGHFHNFQVKNENYGRIVYGSGCLQGSTDYSKTLKYHSVASQGIIIIGENEVIPININLE